MSGAAQYPTQTDWRLTQQMLIQLFRDLDAAHRVLKYLVPSSLAYQRAEREQTRIEAAIETVRQQARTPREPAG